MKLSTIFNQNTKAAKASAEELPTLTPFPEIEDCSRLSDDMIDRRTLFFQELEVKNSDLAGIDGQVNNVSSDSSHTVSNGSQSPSKAQIESKLRALQASILDSSVIDVTDLLALQSSILDEDIQMESSKATVKDLIPCGSGELHPNTCNQVKIKPVSHKTEAASEALITIVRPPANKDENISYETECTKENKHPPKRKINEITTSDHYSMSDKAVTSKNISPDFRAKKPRQGHSSNKSPSQQRQNKVRDNNSIRKSTKLNTIQNVHKNFYPTKSASPTHSIKNKPSPRDDEVFAKHNKQICNNNNTQGPIEYITRSSKKEIASADPAQKTRARKPKGFLNSVTVKATLPSHPYKVLSNQTNGLSNHSNVKKSFENGCSCKVGSYIKADLLKVKTVNKNPNQATTINYRPRWR